jgi:hypothetical protein
MPVTFSIKLQRVTKMKYIVDLYVGGKVFTEEVYANDVKEAKETAKVRNPSCKVIGANVSFR